MKRQPTPLDMLMAEQRRVRESCRVQEQKISSYMIIPGGFCLPGFLLCFFLNDEKTGRMTGEKRRKDKSRCWE